MASAIEFSQLGESFFINFHRAFIFSLNIISILGKHRALINVFAFFGEERAREKGSSAFETTEHIIRKSCTFGLAGLE